jgi:photosystem II stability/assembly factor-like uncharacterized protein
MKKQGLLISVLVLVICSSAVIFSRVSDPSSGKFTLETLKGNADAHHSKAQNYAAAAKWRYDRLKDENGNYYPSYVANALLQANSNRSISRSNGLGLQWQELGPDNVGGRTRAILIDKRDTTDNTVYAGGVSGGMWKSTDGANTWTRIPGFDNWVGIACIAQAPAPDYSIYVGTGVGWDGSYSAGTSFASMRYGNGIFKIGANDSVTLVTPDVMASGFYSPGSGAPWFEVNRIAVNPTNASEIMAATLSGVWKSVDAGANWTQVLFTGSLASLNNVMIGDMKWSADGKNVYSSYYGGMIFSNNGGATWAQENGTNANFPVGAGRVEIAVTPANPAVVYILVSNGSGCTKGVYKSTNGGRSWTVVAVGGPLFQLFEEGGGNGCQGDYDDAIAVSSVDTDKFYMGGVNFYTGSGSSGVQPADYWNSNESNPFYIHADKHTIVIADNNPDLMYIGCDGGIFKSTNALSAFPTPTYTSQNRGYNVTQNYGIAAGLDGSVIGGSQDNGTNYINYYGNSFGAADEVLGGDGFLNAVSQINPNYYFGAVYYAALYRSSDHAATFGGYFDVKVDPLGQGGATVCGFQVVQEDAQFCTPYYLGETKAAVGGNLKTPYTPSDASHHAGEVVAVASANGKYQFDVTLSENVAMDSTVLVDDPVRSRIFMSTSCGVYLTSDALNITIIPRWFQLTNGLSGQGQSFVTTPDANTLYVGTDNGYVYRFSNFNIHADTCTYPAASAVGNLYRSTDPDVQYVSVSNGRSIEGIDVDPADNNHVVAVVAGFSALSQAHVFESHDGGLTWKADSAGLPNMPVYSVVIHSSNQFIIGTEFGVWSWDGTRWHEENGNFERVPVYRLIERNLYAEGCKVLYLGSHGRGMWRSTTLTDVSCQTAIGTAVKNVKPNAITGLSVFPNPVHNSAKISLNIDNSDNVMLRVFDLTGKLYSEKSYKNVPAGTNLFDLDANDMSSGTYLVAATVGDTRTLSKLFVVTK